MYIWNFCNVTVPTVYAAQYKSLKDTVKAVVCKIRSAGCVSWRAGKMCVPHAAAPFSLPLSASLSILVSSEGRALSYHPERAGFPCALE